MRRSLDFPGGGRPAPFPALLSLRQLPPPRVYRVPPPLPGTPLPLASSGSLGAVLFEARNRTWKSHEPPVSWKGGGAAWMPDTRVSFQELNTNRVPVNERSSF